MDDGIIQFPESGPESFVCDCGCSFFFVNQHHGRIWMECADPYCGESYPLIGEFPEDQ